MKPEQTKTIMTVCGPVPAEQCGMILPHEHLYIDLRNQAAPGAVSRTVCAADRPKLMCDPYCMKDNLLVGDEEAAAGECAALKACGCNTVVDCSLSEIGRDPEKLRRLAERTGVNVVMGCGFYTGDTHPARVAELSAEALAEEMLQEIRFGVGDTGIRPGIIGEIGTGKEIGPGERKVLEAAALAQKQSGLAVQVHIYPWLPNGLEAMKILTARGVSPERIVICHSDVEPDWNYISTLLREGVRVELDNFGKEFTPEPGGFAAGIFVPDSDRVKLAAKIIEAGYGKQLLLTNDLCLKCMLSSCGGQGYTHLFRNILPAIAQLGVPEKYLRETVCRANPLELLCSAG